MGDVLAIYALLSMIIGVAMLTIDICKDANAIKTNVRSKKRLIIYILFPIAVMVMFMEKCFSDALDRMYE